MATGTDERSAQGAASRSPLTVEDITADLLWPKLLRAPALGLNPGRMVVAFLAIVTSAVLLNFGLWFDGQIKAESTQARMSQVCAEVRTDRQMNEPTVHCSTAVWRWTVRLPSQMVRKFPVTTLVFFPLALIVWVTSLGAISRMAACEFSQGVAVPWPQGLAFGISRWKSLVGAVVLPLALAWVIGALIALGSAVLLRFSMINLLGGLLYGLMSMGGLAAVAILLGFALGKALLIPAVACDGTDAMDAVQRAYAYVLGRPLRLIAYQVIVMVVVALAVAVAAGVALAAVGFTFEAAYSWTGERARGSLWSAIAGSVGDVPLSADQRQEIDVTGTFAWTAWMLVMWMRLTLVLVATYAASTAMSGMTVMYLLLRRINDGQDVSEIWMPGMVGGTMAKAAAGG